MSPRRRSHRCAACRHVAPSGFDVCPSCGAWGSALAALAPIATLARERVRLADVEPEPTIWLPCPEPWRTALGGGIPAGCTALVYGRGGVGKTTELLRLVGSTPRSIFAACERGMGAAKLREFAERAGIAIPHVWASEARTLAPLLVDLARPPSPEVVIVDSLSSLGDGREVATLAALRDALPDRCALFGVVHVTKAGVMAGAEDLFHEVDLVVHVTRDAFEVDKTRYDSPPTTPRLARAPR